MERERGEGTSRGKLFSGLERFGWTLAGCWDYTEVDSPLECIAEHALGGKEANLQLMVVKMGGYFSHTARSLTEAVPGL